MTFFIQALNFGVINERNAGISKREVTPLICEQCGKVSATKAQTHIENGIKRVLYHCDTCADLTAPKLDRPCTQCKQREGEIKLTRIRPHGRVVTYICQACAKQ